MFVKDHLTAIYRAQESQGRTEQRAKQSFPHTVIIIKYNRYEAAYLFFDF